MKYKIKNLFRKTADFISTIARTILWYFPFVMLLLLLLLGVFQHPAADDFGVYNLTAKLGLGNAVRYFFNEGDSRYFTMPVIFVLTSSRFLLDHYYIVVILLLVFSFWVVYFAVSQLRYFYAFSFSKKQNAWIAALLVLVFVSSVPQLSSLLYWWSASLTYLLPFDLLLLYLVFFFKFITISDSHGKSRWFIILCILSFLLCGSNEEIGFFLVCSMGIFLLYRFYAGSKPGGQMVFLFLADCLLCAFLFFGPGNVKRAGGYLVDRQPVGYSLVSAGYQSAEMAAFIFSSPFFWMAVLFVVLAYPFMKENLKNSIAGKRNLWLELLIIYGVAFAYYFAARALGGWVLHERANNAMVLIVGVWLLVIVARSGFNISPPVLQELKKNYRATLSALLVLFFLFNSFTQNLVKNVWAGYYHNIVLNERVSMIKRSQLEGKHSVRIPEYAATLDSLLNARYSHKWARFIREKLVMPPPFLYFKDDPWTTELNLHYAEYYKIDTLLTGDKKVARLGLQ